MADTLAATAESPVAETPASSDIATSGGSFEEYRAQRAEERGVSPKYPPPPESAGTDGTPATPSPAPSDAAPAAPSQTRGRARFADLARERDTARDETAKEKTAREAAEKERDEWKARASQPTPQQPPQQQHAPQPQYTRPEPTIEDIGTRYDTYEAFTRDQALWVWEQQAAMQQPLLQQTVYNTIAAERAAQRFSSDVEAVRERGRKAYKDFDAQLKGPGGQIPLGRNDAEAMERAQFIVAHPQSEHIQYAIVKDPALATRLQQSDPYTFAATVAGLVPSQQASRPTWTPPPAPPPPSGNGTVTTASSSSEIAQKGGGFDDYRKKRAQERGVKPRY